MAFLQALQEPVDTKLSLPPRYLLLKVTEGEEKV